MEIIDKKQILEFIGDVPWKDIKLIGYGYTRTIVLMKNKILKSYSSFFIKTIYIYRIYQYNIIKEELMNMCRQLTKANIKEMKHFKSSNKHICYYCGELIFNPEDVTVDHKQPVSKGGQTIPENLAIACRKCNLEKDDMTEQEYKEYKKNHSLNNTIITELLKIPDYSAQLLSEITELNAKRIQIENAILYNNYNAAEICKCHKFLKEILIRIKRIEVERTRLKPIVLYISQHKNELLSIEHRVTNAEKQYYANQDNTINKLIDLNSFAI